MPLMSNTPIMNLHFSNAYLQQELIFLILKLIRCSHHVPLIFKKGTSYMSLTEVQLYVQVNMLKKENGIRNSSTAEACYYFRVPMPGSL